LQNRQS